VSAVTDAWQAALAAEHRAAFGYGVLGPHLNRTDQVLAVACSDAHEQLRDRAAAAVSAAGASPVDPRPDYPDLYPVRTAAAARALALRLEDSCAEAWRFLYLRAATGNGSAAVRDAAQSALNASAVRAAKWRVLIDPAAATEAFPGISSK
jgi:hypothetical protein